MMCYMILYGICYYIYDIRYGIWYDIFDICLFTVIRVPAGGSGWQNCTKVGKRQLYTKGETSHKTIYKQNKNTEYKTILKT